MSFLPAMVYSPGQQQDQTVSALPSAGAAVTLFGQSGGQSPQNLVFHKDAFTVASANLVIPKGVDMAYRARSDKLRFSMRAVRDYDVTNDRFPLRIDVLYGWAAQRPELAARVWG